MDEANRQEDQSYEGEHKALFEAFYDLVDDSENQAKALLELTPWRQVNTMLSVGGGEGDIEQRLLQSAPDASVWFIDPSPEQCQAFRDKMAKLGLADRVRDVSQTTFQDYSSDITFDRVVSAFSWFYIGGDSRWLRKLVDLLALGGAAFLILPNARTTEAEFSGDSNIPEFGNRLLDSLQALPCTVERHTYTKWLPSERLFGGEKLTFSAQAFVSFVSRHGHEDFGAEDWRQAYNKLRARLEPQGVPLIWDVLLVKRT